MKKTIAFLCLSVLLASVSAEHPGAEAASPAQGKAAVVYFSKTGNTRTACEVVASELGADVFELKVVKPPAAKGQLPEIEPAAIDLSPYSFMVVASPVWAANLVPAVRAFLKGSRLEGKTVAVLTTANVEMTEQFQAQHKQLVMDAGGNVAGYYQIVMMEQKEGKPVPRAKADIQKETLDIAAKTKTDMSQ